MFTLPTSNNFGQQISIRLLISIHFPVANYELATLCVTGFVQQQIPPPKRALMVAKMKSTYNLILAYTLIFIGFMGLGS
jgi:hypothetical protein